MKLEDSNRNYTGSLSEPFDLPLVKQGVMQTGIIAEYYRRHVSARRGAPVADLLDWMSTQLIWQGVPSAESAHKAAQVLDALLEIGDIGSGVAFGQKYAIPLAQRFILLPNETIAVLGESSAETHFPDIENGVVRYTSGAPNNVEMNLLDELGTAQFSSDFNPVGAPVQCSEISTTKAMLEETPSELTIWAAFLSGRPAIRTSDTFSELADIPSQLRRAFHLCGVIRDNNWSIDQNSAELLTEWVGITHETSASGEASLSPDPDQIHVIAAPFDARIIVEAGPGSGKTFVACKRVAHLIREGIAAPRVWLLSFTRVAVEEMRGRIASTLDESGAAASINVATFDSFAWRLNSAFSEHDGTFTEGYEKAISRTISLLKSEDPDIHHFLQTLEHIVIDEAQDLVGSRRDLVENLLSRLPASCGVTVFSDFAQAIYGFQGKSEASGSLSGKLIEGEFIALRLGTDHRTRNPVLAKLFHDARSVLRDQGISPASKYSKVRSLIEESASASLHGPTDPRFSSAGKPLVLFRGRSALMNSANHMTGSGRSCQIKMSNRGHVVAPWIGAVLAGHPIGRPLSRDGFHTFWRELATEPFELNETEAWDALSTLTGRQGPALSIKEVTEQLERNLPLSLIKDHVGKNGPLLSTIHGAKGRESGRVLLVLPGHPAPPNEEDFDWEEEARILYVGATRARNELFIASRRTGYFKKCPSERQWRGHPTNFSAEIGLTGDVTAYVLPDDVKPEYTTRQSTELIWSLGDMPVSAIARRNGVSGDYLVFASSIREDSNIPLARLSDTTINDLSYISGLEKAELPSVMRGFSIMGGTSAVCRDEADVTNPAGIALLPVLTGFIQVISEG